MLGALVVEGRDSCVRGRDFESHWHGIDGSFLTFFGIKNWTENKKESEDGSLIKTIESYIFLTCFKSSQRPISLRKATRSSTVSGKFCWLQIVTMSVMGSSEMLIWDRSTPTRSARCCHSTWSFKFRTVKILKNFQWHSHLLMLL